MSAVTTTPQTTAPPAGTDAAGPGFSILFPRPHQALVHTAPACFADLNLDQLVPALVARAGGVPVGDYLSTPLGSPEAVGYRLAVFADLLTAPLRTCLADFTHRVDWAHRLTDGAGSQHYEIGRQATLLRAGLHYVDTVIAVTDALAADPPASPGLRRAAAWLADYRASSGFDRLRADAVRTRDDLDRVEYRLRIHGPTIEAGLPRDEPDQVASVLATFARFGAFRPSERHKVPEPPIRSMNHIEAAVSAMAARLYPDQFGALARFATAHADFIDHQVAAFARELTFALAWLDVLDDAGAQGLPSCLPSVEATHHLAADQVYDLVLALKRQGAGVVTNDLQLAADERILIVTGPNQGGKTTFARTVGQLCYLASLGLPVPARRATVPLADHVLTHFQRGENTADQRGGLEDELVRIRDILAVAGPSSVVVVNEIFTSTSLSDAVALSTRMLKELDARQCLTVWVTFLDELVQVSPHIVSLVSQVDPEDPAIRTFKVLPQPPDGLAHAIALAGKHRLTGADLDRRLA
ncbi:MAG: hypothetical protein VB080_08220 [Propionicimonas sp.]|uniref:MutS-related protein n=1 Tax=Propionicimonas sp. TaxID=1955623 RepID=UPI002B20E51C|nr:hypothetical protein [Propionicimonas sp.]MEA4944411.1 hypothetical protein [Propionicimonas sp.]